jgi:UDP-glucose 4-epimerase
MWHHCAATMSRRRRRFERDIMEVCLVTGGAGFIGSHLVKALVARKRPVRVLDNLSTGSLANLGRCASECEVIVGDLEDLDLVREVVDGVGVVFHLGASSPETSSFRSSDDPAQCDLETAHVLLASRDCGVRRVIYASSTQVYGRRSREPRAETDSVAPVTAYARAKLGGEQSCAAFTHKYGLETVRLRYSNVFGPRQTPSSPHARIVPDALASMLLGQPPLLEGSGLEPQDLIDVEDVVQANLLAAEAPSGSGRVYNIAQGRATNSQEIVDVLNALLDTHLAGVPTNCLLEEELQNRIELGFQPTSDLSKSLARFVRSFAGEVVVGPRQGARRLTEV